MREAQQTAGLFFSSRTSSFKFNHKPHEQTRTKEKRDSGSELSKQKSAFPVFDGQEPAREDMRHFS
ncbi:MAG: hypothetical protein LBS57_02670 [Treponema sp.]|jgi:hypothetical protein|nr:hypothetical protein [Treponema sp.]